MQFAHPQMLWLLAVTVSLLAWFLYWAWRRKQSLMAQFVQSRLLAQLTVGVSAARQKLRLALMVAAVAGVMLALARPQWGFEWEPAKQRGLDIVVAIDTSRSMLAEDVRPNRLARAKLAALDLMKLSKSDRLALIPFAGAAFLQCPLTLDEDAFRQSIDALDAGIIPVGGTAITEGIETALQAFKEGDNYKILVLFTDGEDHDSGALAAAEKAAKVGLRIFTVGVGTPNGELLRATDEKGNVSYIKDDQGTVVKSRLNETLLQQIATATGGFYLPLSGANTIKTLYEKGLAPLPKSEISARLVRHYHERFQWPLALAVAALLAEMFLPERKRVARTGMIVNAANAGLRKAVGVLVLLALPCGAALGSSTGAKRLYQEGKYKEAQQEYERGLSKSGDVNWRALGEAMSKPKAAGREGTDEQFLRALENANLGDPRLHFNAGDAAYKAGDLESAEKHFELAMLSRDLKQQQRAFYNLGNAYFRLGEQNPAPDGKIAQWEKAVQSFEGATRLDPQDADAKFNLEFAKRKLEELKKQQPKQQDQQQQKKDQDKEKEDKQKQNQQQDQKQQPDPSQEQNKQEQKEQQPKPDAEAKNQEQQQKQDAQDQQQAGQQEKKDQQQAKQDKAQGGGKGDEKPGEQTEANAAPTPGQMSVQQARQLLDSQKGEERAMIFVPTQKLKDQRRVFKDW